MGVPHTVNIGLTTCFARPKSASFKVVVLSSFRCTYKESKRPNHQTAIETKRDFETVCVYNQVRAAITHGSLRGITGQTHLAGPQSNRSHF